MKQAQAVSIFDSSWLRRKVYRKLRFCSWRYIWTPGLHICSSFYRGVSVSVRLIQKHRAANQWLIERRGRKCLLRSVLRSFEVGGPCYWYMGFLRVRGCRKMLRW